MNATETYLRSLRTIHSTGQAVAETSYYGPLANLLNEIGQTLKPKVHAVINLRNLGGGIPDGGLFANEQLLDGADAAQIMHGGQTPARGAIEVKSTREEVADIAESQQVQRYLKRYGQVLVTNYRDFLFVGTDEGGEAVTLERYSLADGEKHFWEANLQEFVEAQGTRLEDYLKRVMLRAAPISDPKDVAWFLASYAREAKARIETSGLPSLEGVREALEEALGVHFQGEKGEDFFRSTLVQTLFYGLFSAWVLWSRKQPLTSNAKFVWQSAAWSLRIPVIRTLFYRVADPSRLETLNLVEVFDWTGDALNRIDRRTFFDRFSEGQAVQYFYEPFLEAFDPGLRKELGVWYTPLEVVEYMVARVDTALREELGIEDGLADPSVYVLDPCCGTGAYLVEVLKRIAETLRDKGGDSLLASDLKKAAMERIFGFEILPAPFVVAHLQLGLLLQDLKAPLSELKQERVGVYLTNALTGWEGEDARIPLDYPEFKQENDAAKEIKQERKVLVVIGNPPYNAFAGLSPEAESGLVETYKRGLYTGWGIKKFNLDDLYVRFFRLAERTVTEHTGRGVVCYISNFSYLSDPSFVVMRQRFVREFDEMWFDCLNGDSRETGKTTPDGKPDPSVFSTEFNRAGIRVGTAVGLMVRKPDQTTRKASVRFRHLWGVRKRAELLESLAAPDFAEQYSTAEPTKDNRFAFKPFQVSEGYLSWPKITSLAHTSPANGPIERRGSSLIVQKSNRNDLNSLKLYLDPQRTDEEVRGVEPRFMHSSGEFQALKARSSLKGKVVFDEQNIMLYPYALSFRAL